MVKTTALFLLLTRVANADVARWQLSAEELKPDCKVSATDYPGSLHAATTYSVPMTEPKAKAKQSVECSGAPAALMFFEYDEKNLRSEAAGIGARLWGGPAPTAEHTDELLVSRNLLVIVSGPARAPLVAKLTRKGFSPYRDAQSTSGSGDLFAQLANELHCSAGTDPLRAWCPAVGFAHGGYQNPREPQIFLGLSVAVRNGQSVRDALLANVSASVLVLAPGKLKVQSLKPENEAEKQELLPVLFSLAELLKGKKAPVVVDAHLGEYLKSLKAGAASGYAVTNSTKPATVQAKIPSHVAIVNDPRAGKVYVVVEQAPDGTWLNLFPAISFRDR